MADFQENPFANPKNVNPFEVSPSDLVVVVWPMNGEHRYSIRCMI